MPVIKLLSIEQFNLLTTLAIGVQSFYQIDESPKRPLSTIDNLISRVTKILQANPWLCGRLINETASGEDKTCLSYEEEISNPLDYVVTVTTDVLFSLKDWKSIAEIIGPYLPKKANLCVGKDEHLFKFLIFQNIALTEVALVFSLAHCIGDVYTLYYLWKMLDENEDIKCMNVQRDHKFGEYLRRDTNLPSQKIGKIEILKGMFGFLFRGIGRTVLRKPLPRGIVCKVNLEYVNRIKAKYECSDSFVSTNDVLNSWYFGNDGCNTDLVGMAINMRNCNENNRLPEIPNDIAGNYVTLACLRSPDLKDAMTFRKRWTGLMSKEQPATDQSSFMDIIRYGWRNMTTNWAGYYHQVELAGFKHRFHTPIRTGRVYPCIAGIPISTRESLLIFRINRDELGILAYFYNDLPDDFFDNCEMIDRKYLP